MLGGKNILILPGSPRKRGNSDLLADSFAKGAVASGHNVSKFETAFHHINGCLGCNACWSKSFPCIQEDNFNRKLAPLLAAADVLAFYMPLYAFAFPSQIKATIARLYPYGRKSRTSSLKVKDTILIICGADDGDGPYHAVVESYLMLAKHFRWRNRGVLIVPGVTDKGM